jgi:hypothetical protein
LFVNQSSLVGKVERVPIFQPIQKIPRQSAPELSVVGRYAERALLEEKLQALIDKGEGSVIILEVGSEISYPLSQVSPSQGPSGCGKTALRLYMDKIVREKGLKIVAVDSQEYDRNIPFSMGVWHNNASLVLFLTHCFR